MKDNGSSFNRPFDEFSVTDVAFSPPSVFVFSICRKEERRGERGKGQTLDEGEVGVFVFGITRKDFVQHHDLGVVFSLFLVNIQPQEQEEGKGRDRPGSSRRCDVPRSHIRPQQRPFPRRSSSLLFSSPLINTKTKEKEREKHHNINTTHHQHRIPTPFPFFFGATAQRKEGNEPQGVRVFHPPL